MTGFVHSLKLLFRYLPTPTIMAPPTYRSLLELAARRPQWTCRSCSKSQRLPFFRTQEIRRLQTSQKSRQDVAPSMEEMRKPFEARNKNTMYVKRMGAGRPGGKERPGAGHGRNEQR